MRRLHHLSLLCMIMLTIAPTRAQNSSPPDGLVGGSFTVTDGRAHDEISEISHLYINDHLAATFRLDLNHSIEHATIALPVGRENVSYSLCGTITITRHGHPETHIVSSDGVLHHPDGHHYEAVGTRNFTDFFLVDEDENDPSADHKNGHSNRCTVSNS
ncbi:hypothetical protein [Saccharibacter floricola]|uniref:Uncharacterized protein n=1 Tax=Saccharibacter floricola DSM 15669 TaxID=1123227 RepID=A0ABQ0NW05_9PROT|nr:hypothetical protein [Saccharibacter floricola]GBQ04722.1 hypothetical protein AA15669_0107 [Saccharibacter floricola DSM 15669]